MHRSRRIALSLAGVSATAAILVAAVPSASARPGPAARLAGTISLTSPGPAGAAQEHPQAARPARPRYVVVRRGDTLSVIARRVFGSAGDWPALWWANRNLIPDPNVIEAGDGVQIPASPGVSSLVMAKAQSAAAPPPPPAPVTTAQPAQPAQPVTSPPPAAPAPAPPVSGGYGTPPAAFTACVIASESGGDPAAYNPSSGASGLFGFLLSTWDGMGLGYPGGASTAPPSVQYEAFDKLYAEAGASPWSSYDGCQA